MPTDMQVFTKMRKMFVAISVVVLLALVLLIAGCGSKQKKVEPTTPTKAKDDGLNQETQTKINECEKMEKSQGEWCLYILALEKDDPSICKKIGDNATRSTCEELTAPITIDDCRKKADVYERNGCFDRLAGKKGDASICKMMTTGISSCEHRVAISTKDASFCERKEFGDDFKDKCLAEIGGFSADISICEKINNKEERNECFRITAMQLLDISICNKIEAPEEKDRCIMAVEISGPTFSKLLRNEPVLESECEKLLSKLSRDMCYSGVAEQSGDKKICDKVQDETMKESCKTGV